MRLIYGYEYEDIRAACRDLGLNVLPTDLLRTRSNELIRIGDLVVNLMELHNVWKSQQPAISALEDI